MKETLTVEVAVGSHLWASIKYKQGHSVQEEFRPGHFEDIVPPGTGDSVCRWRLKPLPPPPPPSLDECLEALQWIESLFDLEVENREKALQVADILRRAGRIK